MTVDIAVSHSTSPYITAYPWTHNDSGGASGGFGTKYPDPATTPTGQGNGVAFSKLGNDIAVAHMNSPFVTAYPWVVGSGFGTKYSDPVSLPADSGNGVSFSPTGNDIAIADLDFPFIIAYTWVHNNSGGGSGGFGSEYSNPGTVPSGDGYGVAFSPSGNDIAVVHANSPFVNVYPWTSGVGFGTKYTNPVTLPTGDAFGVAFSPSGNDIAVAHNSSPFVTAYPWTSGVGFGTKYDDPSTTPPGGSCLGVAFSPSGNDIALADFTSPYITAYPWTHNDSGGASGGFGTIYSNPLILPASVGNGIAFSPFGNDIAIAHINSPFVTAYPWTHNDSGGASGGFGTKYSNPGILPTGDAFGVAFSPSITGPVLAAFTDPKILTCRFTR